MIRITSPLAAAAGAAARRLAAARPIGRAQAAPIKLGMLTPLTGAGGSTGRDAARRCRPWPSEINAAGGVLGRKIELVVEDDQTNPEAGGARGAQADRCGQGAGRSWAPGPRR